MQCLLICSLTSILWTLASTVDSHEMRNLAQTVL